jgi:hypothetical protein
MDSSKRHTSSEAGQWIFSALVLLLVVGLAIGGMVAQRAAGSNQRASTLTEDAGHESAETQHATGAATEQLAQFKATVARGTELLEVGEWERAVPIFEEALAQATSSPAMRPYVDSARIWLAGTLINTERSSEAAGVLQEVTSVDWEAYGLSGNPPFDQLIADMLDLQRERAEIARERERRRIEQEAVRIIRGEKPSRRQAEREIAAYLKYFRGYSRVELTDFSEPVIHGENWRVGAVVRARDSLDRSVRLTGIYFFESGVVRRMVGAIEVPDFAN